MTQTASGGDWENDPYQVLGVGSSATLEEIQRAYRQKSMTAHPDRGGSHEAMVAATAAWQVLRDPQKRAAYDRQRATPSTLAVRTLWENTAREARSAAETYPRRWAEFQQWFLAAVEDDVRNAQYEWTKAAARDVPSYLRAPPFLIPVNSITGVLFGMVGVSCTITFFVWLNWGALHEHIDSPELLGLRFIWLFALGWSVSVGLHVALRTLVKKGFPSRIDAQRLVSRLRHLTPRQLTIGLAGYSLFVVVMCAFGYWLIYLPENPLEVSRTVARRLPDQLVHNRADGLSDAPSANAGGDPTPPLPSPNQFASLPAVVPPATTWFGTALKCGCVVIASFIAVVIAFTAGRRRGIKERSTSPSFPVTRRTS